MRYSPVPSCFGGNRPSLRVNSVSVVTRSIETIEFWGGDLALDFANTTEGPGKDHLRSYADLVTWTRRAGVLPADRAPARATSTAPASCAPRSTTCSRGDAGGRRVRTLLDLYAEAVTAGTIVDGDVRVDGPPSRPAAVADRRRRRRPAAVRPARARSSSAPTALALPRPQPQRLTPLVLDGRVRRAREDAPLPRVAARVNRLAAAAHRHELRRSAWRASPALGVLDAVQDRVAVDAVELGEELRGGRVGVERGAQVVGDLAVFGES